MRRTCGVFLLALGLAGCNQEGENLPAEVPVTFSPVTISKPVRSKPPQPLIGPVLSTLPDRSISIVVSAKYRGAKGPCIQFGDGSYAMPLMHTFDVQKVLQGTLRQDSIQVRPGSLSGPSFPRQLAEGAELTLRLILSQSSRQQQFENELKNFRWLIINGDELEEVLDPVPTSPPVTTLR